MAVILAGVALVTGYWRPLPRSLATRDESEAMKKLLLLAAIAAVFYYLNRGTAPPFPDAGLQAPPATATDTARPAIATRSPPRTRNSGATSRSRARAASSASSATTASATATSASSWNCLPA